MDKNELRRQLKNIRSSVSDRQKKQIAIENRFLIYYEMAEFNQIFSYVSFGDEVDTKVIIKTISKNNDVFVPYTLGNKMIPILLPKNSKLDVDKHGNLLEFNKGLKESYDEYRFADDKNCAIIIPMLGFNQDLFRIGYGGGYYDKYLSDSKARKIGLAFDEQFIPDLLIEKHDIPLDIIITPSKIYAKKQGE